MSPNHFTVLYECQHVLKILLIVYTRMRKDVQDRHLPTLGGTHSRQISAGGLRLHKVNTGGCLGIQNIVTAEAWLRDWRGVKIPTTKQTQGTEQGVEGGVHLQGGL